MTKTTNPPSDEELDKILKNLVNWYDGAMGLSLSPEGANQALLAWREAYAIEMVNILHRNIDVMTELVRKIQPGHYDGTASIDARILQKTICDFEKDLSQLSSADSKEVTP